MSFGYGVGDIMAVSRLALKVYTAYKDAPDDYRNIADEVKSLHIIIEEAARHFDESTTLRNKKHQGGKEVLEGCQNVLKDLDALIEKYNALAPVNANANAGQVFRRIKLGTKDIVALRARLTSNTTLLNSFIQRLDIATITITIEYIMLISQRSCDSHILDVMQAQCHSSTHKLDEIQAQCHSSSDKLDEIQAQLNTVLGLRRSSSLVSLAASINTKKVYRNFCKGLFDSGVTAEMIKSKEREIYSLFKPPDPTTSSQINGSSNTDQSQFPEGDNSSDSETLAPLPTISTESDQNRLRFPRVLPPMDFLVGPLMLDAARAGNTKRLKSILGIVRDINFMDDTGATALHHAASGGYNDIVQLLLSKGASIEAVDEDIDTPLHIAAWNGHTSTVELLLSKGASIEAEDKYKNTPLYNAAHYGHPSTVELLLSKGASIEATNNYNHTPLHFAAGNGYTSTVELLLSKGASIEVTDKDNNTPLHFAAGNGHTSTMELLLSKGASIEATNNNNNTPLYLARQYDKTKIAKLLERAKATSSLETYETVSG